MISVVIPNYNGEGLLKKNLPKLLELLHRSNLEFELIVIDDASTDDSKVILEEFTVHSSQFTVIYREKNGGFPITADEGIRAAKGEVVFVIKNDAVPEKADYFKLLLEHFKEPPSFAKASAGKKVFAVSAASKTIENGREEIRGAGIIYYRKGFFLHGRGSNQSEVSAWADGSSSAFRKDIYLKLGGFDPIYSPGYWEDVDLGYRAWKAGYRIEFEPKAVLLHDHEQSVFKKKYGIEKLKLINLRNQFNFLWCNADLKYIFLYILWLPYHYAVSIKNWDFTLIKAHLLSELQSIQIFVARWKRKKLVKLTDDQVLREFQ